MVCTITQGDHKQESAVFNGPIFGRPFVKWFALCYGTAVCLSVTLVYCGQTVGWIKMPLGMEIGLSGGLC